MLRELSPGSSAAVSAGATITLIYPAAFFASSNVTASYVGTTLSVAVPGSTQLVITLSAGFIAASTALTGSGITVGGLTMGAATNGGSIQVQTMDANGADYNPSSAVASGPVAGGTWSTAQLSVNRLHLAATYVGNFSIFAGGSTTSSGNNAGVSNVVDLYNSAATSLEWDSGGWMGGWRGGASAVLSGLTMLLLLAMRTTSHSERDAMVVHPWSPHLVLLFPSHLKYLSYYPTISSQRRRVGAGVEKVLGAALLQWQQQTKVWTFVFIFA